MYIFNAPDLERFWCQTFSETFFFFVRSRFESTPPVPLSLLYFSGVLLGRPRTIVILSFFCAVPGGVLCLSGNWPPEDTVPFFIYVLMGKGLSGCGRVYCCGWF